MTRHPTITEKIGRDRTGLNGAVFVHVSHDGMGRVEEITLSHKWKDSGALDSALEAIGESLTRVVGEVQRAA